MLRKTFLLRIFLSISLFVVSTADASQKWERLRNHPDFKKICAGTLVRNAEFYRKRLYDNEFSYAYAYTAYLGEYYRLQLSTPEIFSASRLKQEFSRASGFARKAEALIDRYGLSFPQKPSEIGRHAYLLSENLPSVRPRDLRIDYGLYGNGTGAHWHTIDVELEEEEERIHFLEKAGHEFGHQLLAHNSQWLASPIVTTQLYDEIKWDDSFGFQKMYIEGVATYISYAFTNRKRITFPDDRVVKLKHNLTVKECGPGNTAHHRGKLISGLFYDLDQAIGQDKTLALLFASWKHLDNLVLDNWKHMSLAHFQQALLKADEELNHSQHTKVIQRLCKKRGIKGPARIKTAKHDAQGNAVMKGNRKLLLTEDMFLFSKHHEETVQSTHLQGARERFSYLLLGAWIHGFVVLDSAGNPIRLVEGKLRRGKGFNLRGFAFKGSFEFDVLGINLNDNERVSRKVATIKVSTRSYKGDVKVTIEKGSKSTEGIFPQVERVFSSPSL